MGLKISVIKNENKTEESIWNFCREENHSNTENIKVVTRENLDICINITVKTRYGKIYLSMNGTEWGKCDKHN